MGCSNGKSTQVAIAPASPLKKPEEEGFAGVKPAPATAFAEETSSPVDPKQAAKEAEAEAVRQAIEVYRPPQTQVTLVKAVKQDDMEKMKELLEQGADINHLGLWGNSPLVSACSYGFNAMASALIAANADVTIANEKGATALHFAAAEGMLDVVGHLLEAGAEPKCGAANLYHRLLDTYCDSPPLTAAAQAGFEAIVTLLVEKGAEVDETVKEKGETALWSACRYGQPHSVRALLKHGADPSLVACGVSCVDAACIPHCAKVKPLGDKKWREKTTIETLKVLLEETHERGAPDLTFSVGLIDAVASQNQTAAALLLTHGAKVGNKNARGRTSLHAACEVKNKELIELLLSNKADPKATDSNNHTPMDVLIRQKAKPELIALLTAAGEKEGEAKIKASTGES